MCRTLTVRIENKQTDDALSNVMGHFDSKTATKAIQQLILTHESNLNLIKKQREEFDQLKNEMEHYKSIIRNYLSARKHLDELIL